MAIIDAALTARIGELDTHTAEAIKKEATAAFLRGLDQATALDLARGLHWMARGHPSVCSSEYIIDVLSSGTFQYLDRKRNYLAVLVDMAYTLSYERQSTRIPTSSGHPTNWLDAAMIGWRITLAFELLFYNGLLVPTS